MSTIRTVEGKVLYVNAKSFHVALYLFPGQPVTSRWGRREDLPATSMLCDHVSQRLQFTLKLEETDDKNQPTLWIQEDASLIPLYPNETDVR